MIVIKLAGETDFDGWRGAARQLALRGRRAGRGAWQVDGDQIRAVR